MTIRLRVAPDDLAPGRLEVRGEDHHYLARVRRLRPGAVVTVFDGCGREARARLVRADRNASTLRVDAPAEAKSAPALPIAVILPPLKGDRTEWAIQKLVEIGASAIHPVLAERSVVAPRGGRADARRERYRKVAAEAAKQSGNPSIPHIAPIAPLSEAIAALTGAELKLVFSEGARDAPLARLLPQGSVSSAAVAVGPEGGLTAAELEAAEAAGFARAGLGPRVLRAETAAVTATALLQHTLGDLGGIP